MCEIDAIKVSDCGTSKLDEQVGEAVAELVFRVMNLMNTIDADHAKTVLMMYIRDFKPERMMSKEDIDKVDRLIEEAKKEFDASQQDTEEFIKSKMAELIKQFPNNKGE